MALKWEKVKLAHPLRKPMKGGSTDFIELTVIEARELPESVKQGEDRSHGPYCTTHKSQECG